MRTRGKYKLLASIGRGGMGEVYLAMSHGPVGFRKLVVLKCMNASSADDNQLRKMFLDEAALAARLSHHNVVQTYEAGELDGAPYIAMEYLDGQPLSRLTQAAADMDPRLAAHIISEALGGLHYAHQLKDFDGTPLAIVHRDLSPPNIFITYDGVVKVVDFGIAKTSLASRTQTDTGILKGKISYMAPEQALHEEVDHRADIFSLGTVLWELVAGKRLFREVSPALTLKRLIQDEIPSPASVKPDLAPALIAIIMRALQRDPAARYANAQAMRQDLEGFLRAGEPTNWDAELAALMSAKFADARQKIQRQVQICMSADTEDFDHLPRMSWTDSGSGASSSRYRTEAADQQPSSVELSIDDSGAWAASSARQEPSRAQRRLTVGGMVAALVASLALAAWLVLSADHEPARGRTAAAAQSGTSAEVEVLSTPPGALIFVDGEPSGLTTPAVLKGLKAGRSVTIRLDKAGHQAKEERVTPTVDRKLTHSVRLLEASGLVRFAGAPAGARLYLDDVAVSGDFARGIDVSVGSHQLRVEASGSLVHARKFQVVAGEQTIRIESPRSVR